MPVLTLEEWWEVDKAARVAMTSLAMLHQTLVDVAMRREYGSRPNRLLLELVQLVNTEYPLESMCLRIVPVGDPTDPDNCRWKEPACVVNPDIFPDRVGDDEFMSDGKESPI